MTLTKLSASLDLTYFFNLFNLVYYFLRSRELFGIMHYSY